MDQAETEDEATLRQFKRAIVRTYAADFGYVKLAEGKVTPSYAWAQPLYGESARGDWHGTIHEPIHERLPGMKATNIHVTDAWMLSTLVAAYGECYRVLDSDIHFFVPDGVSIAMVREWLAFLPDRDAEPPTKATIAGYPYGVRGGDPIASTGKYSGVGHETGRPDCHWYREFPDPNAEGKSGSPAFSYRTHLGDSIMNAVPFGITTARGFLWEGEDVDPHWAVIQCYHNEMRLEQAA